jgi:hypothetical protein
MSEHSEQRREASALDFWSSPHCSETSSTKTQSQQSRKTKCSSCILASYQGMVADQRHVEAQNSEHQDETAIYASASAPALSQLACGHTDCNHNNHDDTATESVASDDLHPWTDLYTETNDRH